MGAPRVTLHHTGIYGRSEPLGPYVTALNYGVPQQARLLGDVLLPSLTGSLASSRLSRGSPLQQPRVLGVLLQTPHFLGVPRRCSPPVRRAAFSRASLDAAPPTVSPSAVHPPPLPNSTKSTSPACRNPRSANGSVPSARVSGPAPASRYGTEEKLDIQHRTQAAPRRWQCDLSLGGAEGGGKQECHGRSLQNRARTRHRTSHNIR
ncbi:hypothetical protein HPB47_001676 [Ixodes persulcatus]|uniref:Uncharacterized protein n=1 Tax=Ixodes persulcatus TaxID=34615 RepID=A0AC60PPN1_IXOPE|nr:hypothetical protein HPB47_001676 [Ixodes persulcatus]